MEKWLSFIVPVYNVEDYLSECVDSLLNQDVPSELYEIILYDDGSTDGSLRIAPVSYTHLTLPTTSRV